jgi:two-component system, LytTR family, sensor kinase
MKLPKLLLLTATGLLVGWMFYTYLYYSEAGMFPVYTQEPWLLLFTLATFVLIAAGISGARFWLNRWMPWQQMITLRFLTGLLGNILLAMLVIGAGACFYVYAFPDYKSIAYLLETYKDAALKAGILVLLAAFIYTIVDFTIYSYKQFARQQLASVRLTQTQLSLQVQILRNQLSPHFLFNSMNTISALVYQNKEAAEQFIRKLTHTYQYILSTHTKPLVTLAEETAFLKAYLFLLEARFEGALAIEVNLPEQVMQHKIPPLTLQLLVENAVKHNQLSKEQPLHIKIYVDMYDQITVKNTLQPKKAGNDSFKIGLNNIRGRYHYLTSRQIQVLQDSHFTVKLPPIQQPHEAGIYS